MSEETQPGIQESEQDAAVVNIGSQVAAASVAPASASSGGGAVLPQSLVGLQNRIKALNAQQRLILSAAVFLVIAVLVFVSISGRSKDDYRILFSSIISFVLSHFFVFILFSAL